VRIVSALVLVVTAAFPAAQAAGRYVNLNKPGAMDRLKGENPTHYRAVSKILQAALRQAEPAGDLVVQHALAEWFRILSTYKAEDVDYSPILLASDPPKRELSFRLDDVRYSKILTLSHVQAVAEPAGAVPPRAQR
jgi:hypothetical protein